MTVSLYNINDSYYINLAIDEWLFAEEDDDFTTEDEDVNNTKEGCMTDD